MNPVYRYRKFDIGNDLHVIVRCEHDGYIQGANGEKQFLTVKALNEWDSKVFVLSPFMFLIYANVADI